VVGRERRYSKKAALGKEEEEVEVVVVVVVAPTPTSCSTVEQ